MPHEMPTPAHVGGGVWSIPIPIPGTVIGWVFAYALVGPDDVWVIDPGWDRPESRQCLVDGLAEAGALVSDVTGVLVTHVHADHYGLAGWVRDRSDAWVGMHPADTELVHDRYQEPGVLLERGDRWLRQSGAPDAVVATLRDASMAVLENVHAIVPDRDVLDAESLASPVGEVVAVHTPGHTPGHLCFDVPGLGVVFTGDHLLRRIVPNVGWHPQSDDDPLGDYVESLGRVRSLAAPRALPGHVAPFADPAARADEIRAHHEAGLEFVLAQLADAGARTAWDVAGAMRYSKPWGEIEPFFQRAAVAEVNAKLVRLERTGRVTGDRSGDVWTWRPQP